VVNRVFAIRLIQGLGWVFETQERKKERKKPKKERKKEIRNETMHEDVAAL